MRYVYECVCVFMSGVREGHVGLGESWSVGEGVRGRRRPVRPGDGVGGVVRVSALG